MEMDVFNSSNGCVHADHPCEATAYYYEGMIWGEFDPTTKIQQEWGTIILDFPWWGCNVAHMAWFPTMEGFTQGETDLVRLTSLYGRDCAEPQDHGNWEVQFGFDADLKYPVAVVPSSEPEEFVFPDLIFEFVDETGCLWSGYLHNGQDADYWHIQEADWGNQCGDATVQHSGTGREYFEYKLCDSENVCVWKDEVMIFEDEGEYLIFSR